jgi:hypothetical protein
MADDLGNVCEKPLRLDEDGNDANVYEFSETPDAVHELVIMFRFHRGCRWASDDRRRWH